MHADECEGWFYGPPEGRRRKKETTDSPGSPAPSIGPKKPRISISEEAWGSVDVFARQRDAFAMKKERGPSYRVFSFEHQREGQRRFMVTTVERFWKCYEEQTNKSFYEVIPNDAPARLYFDLEFYRESNPDADQAKLIGEFNDCVTETLNEEFQISINPKKHMLILDSSTSRKFSEHIIVHLPGNRLFPNNLAMKPFIQKLENKMVTSSRCVVNNADATNTCTICDVGVYTLNRNFRMFLSTKFGKANPLKRSPRCQFYDFGKEVASWRIFRDSLVVPAFKSSDDHNFLIEPQNEENIPMSQPAPAIILPVKMQQQESVGMVEFMSGVGASSPFPMLDQYIILTNRKWRSSASIRNWRLYRNTELGLRKITYTIAGCRYCFNIEREHRSNGVYWTVDLQKLHCFQKCFDADCQGISSNYFPLPYFVRATIPSLEEISNVSHSRGEIHEVDLPTLSLATEMNKMDEKTAESDERMREVGEKLRRRSATIEKFTALETDDSFYNHDNDDKLHELLDELEAEERRGK